MADNEWTDELKKEIIEEYLSREPTPDNTIDLVKELATEYEKTPNGVRMILSKADVYVRKDVASAAKSSNSSGAKRVNKAEAIQALKDAISDKGKTVDNDICDRLTGKAAMYLTEIIK